MTPMIDVPTIDVPAYLARVGWSAPTPPTLATAGGLLTAHLANIPFENFDVLLGRPIRLDPPSIEAKLVHGRRGGYCFEHATLMAEVLTAIGFIVRRHAARVLLFKPRAEASRDHMFLTLEIDGVRHVLDPGFGAFAPATPVPLDGTPVPPEAPTHRMRRQDDEWALLDCRGGAEAIAWVSTLELENPCDFELANHFVATHPNSVFVNRIMASAVTPGGRVNIMNDAVTRLHGDTRTETTLPDRRALRATLATDFGFDLPEAEAMTVPSLPGWA